MGAGCKAFHALRVGKRPMKNYHENLPLTNLSICARKGLEGGVMDYGEQNWPKIHEALVDAMIRLHKAINPHIQYLSN